VTSRRGVGGGELPGGTLEPAPAEVRRDLEAVLDLWHGIEPDLETVAAVPRSDPRFGAAYDRVEERCGALNDASHRVVSTFDARASRLRRQMLAVLAAVAVATGLVFIVGLWLTRRFVVRPIRHLDVAARCISGGDFSQRLEVNTRDELATLAGTFNDMAEQVERLLGKLDLQRKHAERIVFSVPAGLLDIDSALRIVAVNRSFPESCNCELGTLVDHPAVEVLGVSELEPHLRQVLASDETLSGIFCTVHCPGSGKTMPVKIAVASTGLKGEKKELLVFVEDLSRVEGLAALARVSDERLRRSEASFRALIERSPDSVAVHRHGRFVYVNPAVLAYLGYDHADELVGRPILDVVHWEDREVAATWMRATEDTGGPTPAREERFLRRDGGVVTAEVVALPLVFDGELAVVAVARDVTERRQLAAKMMQMDRMIAIGTLAAGVAHEINNPLAYVVANLDFVAREFPGVTAAARRLAAALTQEHDLIPVDPAVLDSANAPRRLEELHQALDEAREGASRIRNIVRDLKTFSRVEDDQREPVALQRVIESAVNMAWNEIRHRARLVKDYGPVPPVEASESRLGQVFLNLLVNAAQAIPEGRVEHNEIRVVTLTDGAGRALIEVRDTGSGIPPEAVERIFDPFFTTKPVGQGTGLGLSICQTIVQGLGGELTVKSEVGKGTTFQVVLPAAPMNDTEQRPIWAKSPTPAPGRRGNILIVDDEPMIGRALLRILAPDHDVVVVTRGREAVERLERGERYDVILCDLMMPEMTGMDLHAGLSLRFSECAARMVFLTGGVFTPQARDFLDTVPNQRIEKPFSAQSIRALVRELLR